MLVATDADIDEDRRAISAGLSLKPARARALIMRIDALKHELAQASALAKGLASTDPVIKDNARALVLEGIAEGLRRRR